MECTGWMVVQEYELWEDLFRVLWRADRCVISWRFCKMLCISFQSSVNFIVSELIFMHDVWCSEFKMFRSIVEIVVFWNSIAAAIELHVWLWYDCLFGIFPEQMLAWIFRHLEHILASCDNNFCYKMPNSNPVSYILPAILNSKFPFIEAVGWLGCTTRQDRRICNRINRLISTMLLIISTLSFLNTTL